MSRTAVSHLLAVDRKKGTPLEGKIRAHPVVVAGINVFFCAYFEQYLRIDPEAHYLAIFLFLQSWAALLFGAVFLSSGGYDILVKATLFPLTAWERLLFVLSGTVGRPMFLGWVGTTSLFLIILYRSEPVAGILGVVVAFWMMVFALLTVFFVVLLRLLRTGRSTASLGIVLSCGVLVVLASLLIFHAGSFLDAVPLLSWGTAAIVAAVKSDGAAFLTNIGLLAGLSLVSLVLGRRFA